MNDLDVLQERYALVMERIRQIPGEHFGNAPLEKYFSFCAEFLMMMDDTMWFLVRGGLEKASLEELKRRNHAMYEDILPKHYEESYGNPAWAVKLLGEELGAKLSFLYTELRSLIGFVHEGKLEDVVIRMELFVEVYAVFCYAVQEEGELPSGEEVRRILYWFVSDYADVAAERRIGEQVCAAADRGTGKQVSASENSFYHGISAWEMIMERDLTDVRYLYGYGEYVSDSELETAGFLAGLPEDAIAGMADTYMEGYQREFEAAGRDLSKKRTVGLCYRLGYERMMRRAVRIFEKMGLKATVFRRAYSVLDNRGADDSGFRGAIPNRQFDYDHKDDMALFLDKNYVNRKLEVTRTAYEKYREQARDYGGPAVAERFGEADFNPVWKKEALKLTPEQNRLRAEYLSRAEELRREYIPED